MRATVFLLNIDMSLIKFFIICNARRKCHVSKIKLKWKNTIYCGAEEHQTFLCCCHIWHYCALWSRADIKKIGKQFKTNCLWTEKQFKIKSSHMTSLKAIKEVRCVAFPSFYIYVMYLDMIYLYGEENMWVKAKIFFFICATLFFLYYIDNAGGERKIYLRFRTSVCVLIYL